MFCTTFVSFVFENYPVNEIKGEGGGGGGGEGDQINADNRQ